MSAETGARARRASEAALKGGMWRDLLAWAGFGAAVLALLWPLGLTNRVLAGVDAFTYFQPYWTYRNAVMSGGALPLWNPYLFLGAPFLANPQASVLYPLHWPFIWMQPERALIWSALLHVWLAAGLTYTFARRSLHATRTGAWLAGLLYGMGGFALARVENINQLNAIAWLPAMLWLYDETLRARSWRVGLRWGTGLVAAVTLPILAGHTQSAFVSVFGLGLYAIYGPARWAFRRLTGPARTSRSQGATPAPVLAEARALLPLLAILPAVLLSAAQLLPSLELNRLGLRTEGLPYRQAVSFSLRPQLIVQSLLPPYGGGLAEAFASEGYAEFVAYLGITGLVLAGFAVVRIARLSPSASREQPSGDRPGALLVLAIAGLFLALGAYNPVYYLLWRVVPGFDLFRAPVRWLELTALGLAALAGMGLDQVGLRTAAQAVRSAQDGTAGKRLRAPLPVLILIALLGGGLAVLLAFQRWPSTTTLLSWLAAALLAGAGVWAGRRWPRGARAGLVALAVVELWLASRALPFTLATAPYVLSLRNAPAALLARVSEEPAAGRDRFLSMSDIRYDPGDLAELRDLMAGALPADAVERLVRGAKQTEVIAPNLALRLGLPGADGYDGGLLPTLDYGRLQTLFLPEDQRLPDGRMREQLQQIPPGRLLDLAGVRFVVTDKQKDLWVDNVYYDLEQAATIKPGESLTLDLAGYPRFAATALGVVSHLDGTAPKGAVAAEIEVQGQDGRTTVIPVRAGQETASGSGPAGDARVARLWPEWTGAQGQDYLALIELGEPLAPAAITVRVRAAAPASFVLQGLSLVDGRTGAHSSVTVSPAGDFRRVHSGDVKIYERKGALGRAWLVHGIAPAADADTALRLLGDPGFNPRQTAVVEGEVAPSQPGAAQEGETVRVLGYTAEQVRLQAEVKQPAVLVLADAYYPGWQAAVDGRPVPILRANLMFRGVLLQPGSHEVTFSYAPSSLRWGARVTVATLLLLVGGLLVTWLPFRRRAR